MSFCKNLHLEWVELKVTSIYKLLYQINDVVLGLLFLIGSFMFFRDSTMFTGTVLFVIGSIQMLIRPVISIIHDFHLSKIRGKNT
ncbi:YrhK family protein [Oceanobacillus sojae]|uniref:YrhK family protein n=1 Tax=Oceanobacillus sojae TaxID=582851 RepID=UPI0020C94068|nr:YrhK family protein [Oceanobacillus sojae]MCT1902391.1 YrhK family protein [Oceanobacillus sojae]